MIEVADSVFTRDRLIRPLLSTDDDARGMAWWNALSEEARRYWMRLAGDTGVAADAWRVFKAKTAQMTGRELDPRQVLTDLFEELRADDPEWLADRVIERLRDAGFTISPTEQPKPPHEGGGA